MTYIFMPFLFLAKLSEVAMSFNVIRSKLFVLQTEKLKKKIYEIDFDVIPCFFISPILMWNFYGITKNVYFFYLPIKKEN